MTISSYPYGAYGRCLMATRPSPGTLRRMSEPAVADSRELLLVTTEECHFCEHAHTVLAGLGVGVREVDVASAEAEALAGRGVPLAFLPVLTDGERVIAYGRFSEKRLRKELGL